MRLVDNNVTYNKRQFIRCNFFQSEDAADRPQYQALVDPLQSDETSDSKQEELPVHQQSTRNAESQTAGNDQSAQTPVQIKLPLELDIDEIVGVSIFLFYFLTVWSQFYRPNNHQENTILII